MGATNEQFTCSACGQPLVSDNVGPRKCYSGEARVVRADILRVRFNFHGKPKEIHISESDIVADVEDLTEPEE